MWCSGSSAYLATTSSPRLADVGGGTRFWRTRPDADYGKLNGLARQSVKLDLIAEHWDDLLRLAGSAQTRPGAGDWHHAHAANGEIDPPGWPRRWPNSGGSKRLCTR